MTDHEITALAREYAEFTDTSDLEKKHISAICENYEEFYDTDFYVEINDNDQLVID